MTKIERFMFRMMSPSLFDLIQPYKVTDQALMPAEYRYPNGRYTHDDWFVFKSVLRIDCAYRVPLPYRVARGSYTKEWMLFDPAYPLSPGMQTEQRLDGLYVLTDRGSYGLVTYEAFVAGAWRIVFRKYTGKPLLWLAPYVKWMGLNLDKRLSWYWGLHQDNHVSPPSAPSGFRPDLMTWYPEFAISFVKEI